MSRLATCTTFLVGGVEYALPSRFVLGCRDTVAVLPVPLAADWVLGVTEWSGQLVPCLDAGRLLRAPRPRARGGALVFLGSIGTARYALHVERVTGVRPDPIGWQALPPPTEGPVQTVYQEAGRSLHYLDPARLVPPDERRLLPLPVSFDAQGPVGRPGPPLLLAFASGGRPYRIEPSLAGPILEGKAFAPLAARSGSRLVGVAAHGRRRLPVLRLEPDDRPPGTPAGVLVVHGPGWLAGVLVDATVEFRPDSEGADLDPPALLTDEDAKRMNRIAALRNWRVDKPAPPPSAPRGELHLLANASGREVVLAAADVLGVLGPIGVLPVPDPTGRLAGLVEFEGRAVPAVDVESLFRGVPRPAPAPRPAIVVAGADGPWAFRVDRVDSLAHLSATDLLAVDESAPGLQPRYARACARLGDPARLVPVLDAAAIAGRLAEDRTAAPRRPTRGKPKKGARARPARKERRR